LLGALVVVAVAGVAGCMGGRLDQRPTQIGRAVEFLTGVKSGWMS
jgi:hypothetical protein